MSLTDIWNNVALPLLGLAAGLGSIVAVIAMFKVFGKILDKLNDLD